MAKNSIEDIKEQFKKIWKHGHPQFFDLLIKMAEIHEIKNKGYGIGNPLGNFLESERFGIPAWKGCLVRLSDKVSRLYNLTAKMDDPNYADAVKMESIEDTLIDLANYSLLCLILFKERKDKPKVIKMRSPRLVKKEEER